MKITTQIKKGLLDFLVLAAIAKQAKYPREIIEQLNVHGLDIVEGTIYPLFLRLYKNGLVTYEWREASGHPRKYYSLTEQGQTVLGEYQEEWDKLTNVINKLGYNL